MHPGRKKGIRPCLERLEGRQAPSAGPSGVLSARSQQQPPPATGVTLERITNPTPTNTRLNPPFDQVRVQAREPVKGGVYNVVFISLRNSTGRTFDAGSGLAVRITGQPPRQARPILAGEETWDPGEVIVLYFLTKQYYPLRPIQSAGFEFNFVNPRVVAIPGPSGFFQRIRYDPATFPGILDAIVVSGPGSKGHELGLPDTALWEIIPASKPVVPL